MRRHDTEVKTVIQRVEGAKNYFCQDSCAPLSSSETILDYWGNSRPIAQLESYLNVAEDSEPGAIIIVTDNGSYEAGQETQKIIDASVPVWVLHLGGIRPYAYANAWIATVKRSGGGFLTGDISELLLRISLADSPTEVPIHGVEAEKLRDLRLDSIHRDWLWFDGVSGQGSDYAETYRKLGAAISISHSARDSDAPGLGTLDRLHDQAMKAYIVTEYSSMIVLVNEEQKKALEIASKKADRFDRENENGQQVVSFSTDNLSVAAVPEPREWLMIMVISVSHIGILALSHQYIKPTSDASAIGGITVTGLFWKKLTLHV